MAFPVDRSISVAFFEGDGLCDLAPFSILSKSLSPLGEGTGFPDVRKEGEGDAKLLCTSDTTLFGLVSGEKFNPPDVGDGKTASGEVLGDAAATKDCAGFGSPVSEVDSELILAGALGDCLTNSSFDGLGGMLACNEGLGDFSATFSLVAWPVFLKLSGEAFADIEALGEGFVDGSSAKGGPLEEFELSSMLGSGDG